jgi:hypothetical protein
MKREQALAQFKILAPYSSFPAFGEGDVSVNVGGSPDGKMYLLFEKGGECSVSEITKPVYLEIRRGAARMAVDSLRRMFGDDSGHGVGSSDVNVYLNESAFELFCGCSVGGI